MWEKILHIIQPIHGLPITRESPVLLKKWKYFECFSEGQQGDILGIKLTEVEQYFIVLVFFWYWFDLGKFLFQLFDLIYREETLFNVIKSVTRNGRSILLTALLALILVYLFSIVGFLFLKDDFILEVDPLPNLRSKGLFSY